MQVSYFIIIRDRNRALLERDKAAAAERHLLMENSCHHLDASPEMYPSPGYKVLSLEIV